MACALNIPEVPFNLNCINANNHLFEINAMLKGLGIPVEVEEDSSANLGLSFWQIYESGITYRLLGLSQSLPSKEAFKEMSKEITESGIKSALFRSKELITYIDANNYLRIKLEGVDFRKAPDDTFPEFPLFLGS